MTDKQKLNVMQAIAKHVVQFTQCECMERGIVGDDAQHLILVRAVVDHTEELFRKVLHPTRSEAELQLAVAETLRRTASKLNDEADHRVAAAVS